MADVVLTGDAQLLRRLNALEGKIQRKVAAKAAREALRPTLAAARAGAPVKSGRLRRSVKLRALKRSRKGRVGARVTTGSATGDFQGSGYYGAFVEFGHKIGRRSRALKALERRASRRRKLGAAEFRKARQAVEVARRLDNRAEAKPVEFMKRAADSTRAQSQEIYRRELAAGIVRETLAVN